MEIGANIRKTNDKWSGSDRLGLDFREREREKTKRRLPERKKKKKIKMKSKKYYFNDIGNS
jgi:hypothetical protein